MFTIATYDQYAGRGNELSTTQVIVTVSSGMNKVQAVLDAVPVSASVQRVVSLPEATPTSVPLAVTAYDADGAMIVGPGNYTTPVILTDSDSSGGTTVTPKLSGPASKAVVTYNGTANVTNAYISAQVGKSSTQGQTTGFLRVVPQYSEFNTPSGDPATLIAAARDGTMWVFEDASSQSMILAHVTASGVATEMPIDSSIVHGVGSAVAGPDGALWCVTGSMWGASTPAVVRIDSAGNPTAYTNAGLSSYGGGAGIVVGPDNRMWFPQRGSIVAIDTSGNFTFYSYPTTPIGLDAVFTGITVGPDGNLWAAESDQGGLLRITTAGVMTYFTSPTVGTSSNYVQPTGIATQGNYLDVTSNNTLYQIDTSGNLHATYALPNFNEGGITTASNGAAWVPSQNDPGGGTFIGRLSATGALTTISLPYLNDPWTSVPTIAHLASAADGSMWYTRGNAYGRIVVR
jgi:hypothetical protein